MKKIFVLLILISFVMICSCQKQDSATEAQLAQRKTELDAREKALDEREKELALRETVLNERERAKKDKAIATAPTASPNVQSRGQVPDAAQSKADREKRLQQLPLELRALVPDAAQIQAARDRVMQRQLDQRQLRLEELQRMRAQMQSQAGASDAGRTQMNTANPATTAAPAAVYPGADAISPTPSPTPQ